MLNYDSSSTNESLVKLTNYDIFKMNKNKRLAQSRLFGGAEKPPVRISYEDYQKKLNKEPSQPADYKAYLLEQLERRSPERLLSEQEFHTRAPGAAALNKAKASGGSKLKKGAKIFILCYVLIVMAVASILIVINTAGSRNPADAASSVTEQSGVQPMTVDSGDRGKNWFDRLCDSQKK